MSLYMSEKAARNLVKSVKTSNISSWGLDLANMGPNVASDKVFTI